MGRFSGFMRLCAILFVSLFAVNAFGAGYTCPELKNYTSCNPGYYLSISLDGPRSCVKCPAGYYCEGGTKQKYDCDTGTFSPQDGSWTSAEGATSRNQCYRTITLSKVVNQTYSIGTLSVFNPVTGETRTASGRSSLSVQCYYGVACTFPTVTQAATTSGAGDNALYNSYVYFTGGWVTSGTDSTGGTTTEFTFDENSASTLYPAHTSAPIDVVLNPNKGTDTSGVTGTATIYSKYGSGIYLDSAATSKLMTSSQNPITVPTRAGYVFAGYYDSVAETANQMINASGYYTGSGSTITGPRTWTARWTPCTAGYYCPAGSTSTTAYACPTNYTSDAGAGAQGHCYRDVTLNWASATGMTLYWTDGCGIERTWTPSSTSQTINVCCKYGSTCNLPSPIGLSRPGYKILDTWFTNTPVANSMIGNIPAIPITSTAAVFNMYPAMAAPVVFTLDGQSADTAGTTKIYAIYKDAVYLDAYLTKQMTVSTVSLGNHPIALPTKSQYTFGGYYTSSNCSGTRRIDANGRITSNFASAYVSNATFYACWIKKEVTCTAGNYLVAGAETCTPCGSGDHYCPGGSFTIVDGGGRYECPAVDDTTTITEGWKSTVPTDMTVIWKERNVDLTNLPAKTSCRANYLLRGATGDLAMEAVYFDESTGKYSNDSTVTQYYRTVNPGYYLTTPYMAEYCTWGSVMYYQHAKPCPAGSYCPGLTQMPACSDTDSVKETFGYTSFAYGNDLGAATCTFGTDNKYPSSAAGASDVSQCYLTTTAGKWVSTAGAGQEPCTSGDYCQGGTKVYYGSSAGFATGGNKSCLTVDPFWNLATSSGEGYRLVSPTGSSSGSACQLVIDPGYYVDLSGDEGGSGECTLGGYYCPGLTLKYGQVWGGDIYYVGEYYCGDLGNGSYQYTDGSKVATSAEECYRTVSLNKNGGSGTLSYEKPSTGSTITAPGVRPLNVECYYNKPCTFPDASGLTQTNYAFSGGWGTSAACETGENTFAYPVANSTYYACKVQSICEAGYYSNNGTCTVCPAGSYCPGGESKYDCPTDTTSDAGTKAIGSCYYAIMPGFYWSSDDRAVKPCLRGYYCPASYRVGYSAAISNGGPPLEMWKDLGYVVPCMNEDDGWTWPVMMSDPGASEANQCYVGIMIDKNGGTGGVVANLDRTDLPDYFLDEHGGMLKCYPDQDCRLPYSDTGLEQTGYEFSNTWSVEPSCSDPSLIVDFNSLISTWDLGWLFDDYYYYGSSFNVAYPLFLLDGSGPYNAEDYVDAGNDPVGTVGTLYACKSKVSVTCAAGSYLPANSVVCATCKAGYSCPDNATTYAFSDVDQGITPCYPGYYQPNTGQTSCKEADKGYYTSGPANTTQTPCAEKSYQDETGQWTCKPCPTPIHGAFKSMYSWSSDGVYDALHTCWAKGTVTNETGIINLTCGASDISGVYGYGCRTDNGTVCNPGYYFAGDAQLGSFDNVVAGSCSQVGPGYYFAGGMIESFKIAQTREQCPDRLTTIGYGVGANEADDCGRKLHAGENVIYLRSAQRTTPSLRVRVGDDVFFGSLSETIEGALKVNKDGTKYSVVNDWQ